MPFQKIKNFSNSIVIIDDTFIQIEPTRFSEEAARRYGATAISHNWDTLKTELFSEVNDPRSILADEELIERAWSAFNADSTKYNIFSPLFEGLIENKKIDQFKVGPFADELQSSGFEVKRFPDLLSAEDEIKKCKLLFIDFFLSQGTKENMIEKVKEFREVLSNKVTPGSEYRITFLMSSQLPDFETIEEFRAVTNIKGAFFATVDKKNLDSNWFLKEMARRELLYKDMTLLCNYLESFSETINNVSSELKSRINSIELHDITLLNAVRLIKEEEKLGNYLSWLFSETLASKIRENPGLNHAAKNINKIQNLPFVGTLKTKQILLDCFAEVTFSYPDINSDSDSIYFGDVFIPYKNSREPFQKETSSRPPNGRLLHRKRQLRKNFSTTKPELDYQKLYLVISPACDLLRCSLNHRVLCAVGHIIKSSSKLSDLFDQDYIHGENRHLIKLSIKNIPSYAIVEWDTKAISTFEVKELKDRHKFSKKAKLSELFSHQVKEEALSKLARIGIPVDPSHSIHYDATVKFKDERFHSPSRSFSAAVCMAGNKSNDILLILSDEYKSWIINEIESKYPDNPPKVLNQFLVELKKELISRFDLNSKKEANLVPNGVMKLKIVDKFDESYFSKVDIEMILYPKPA